MPPKLSALRLLVFVALLAVGVLVAASGGAGRVVALSVTIRSGPSDPTTSANASLAFSANSAGVSFSCAVDKSTPSTCTSPAVYQGLAAGTHTFTVTGSTRTERASDSWTWTIKSPLPTMTTEPTTTTTTSRPPSLAARRVPLSFHRDSLHGPYVLTAKALRRLPAPSDGALPRGATPPDQDDDVIAEQERVIPCADPPCVAAASVGTREALSPVPPKPFVCCEETQAATGPLIDPQIAASNSYLVIGMHHKVLFYDKAGDQLYTKAAPFPAEQRSTAAASIPNQSYPYTVQLCDLFKPLIPHMNAALHLPNDLVDVDGNKLTVQNGYGLNCNSTTGGIKPATWTAPAHKNKVDNFYWPYDTIFDARVLWDEYHHRFWIAALAQNKNSLHRGELGPATQATYDTARSRRALLAIAVSKTDDPRDGWLEYWAWGYPGQDICPKNECPYYGRGDFLWAGITSKYLALESNVSDARKQGQPLSKLPGLTTGQDRTEIVVIPTDPGVNLGSPNPVYSNLEPLTNPDGTTAEHPWPAMQHAPDAPGNHVFLASLYRTGGIDNVLIWTLAIGNGGGVMWQQPVTVDPVQGIEPPEAPQPSGATTRLFGGGITKLAYRNGSLYASFAECGDWLIQCLHSAMRFVRIEIKGIVNTPQALTLTTNKAVDLRFTGPAASDPPGFKAWYGFVGVEANKSGDAVLAYQRTGSFVAPEARYSAYYLTESDVRASQLLMAGNSSLGQCPADLTKNQNCTHHYMGMSVDPWDQTGVWVIDGFALNKRWGFVVGKALAPGYPDLTFDAASVLQRSSPGAYHLRLALHNQGDGAARANVVRVYLAHERTGKGADRLVKSIRLDELGRGDLKRVDLVFSIPPAAADYRYVRVRVDADQRLREYDERNNTTVLPLPTARSTRPRT